MLQRCYRRLEKHIKGNHEITIRHSRCERNVRCRRRKCTRTERKITLFACPFLCFFLPSFSLSIFMYFFTLHLIKYTHTKVMLVKLKENLEKVLCVSEAKKLNSVSFGSSVLCVYTFLFVHFQNSFLL